MLDRISSSHSTARRVAIGTCCSGLPCCQHGWRLHSSCERGTRVPESENERRIRAGRNCAGVLTYPSTNEGVSGRPRVRPDQTWAERARVAGSSVVLLWACVTIALAGDSLSGRALLGECTSADGRLHVTAACTTYFRGVLDALRSADRPDSIAHCTPETVTIEQLVALYVSESRQFPHVLDVPAAALIAGMLVKFFPCQSARLDPSPIHAGACSEYAG